MSIIGHTKWFQTHNENYKCEYSQSCIKRIPLIYNKKWYLNTGECLSAGVNDNENGTLGRDTKTGFFNTRGVLHGESLIRVDCGSLHKD